MTQEKIKILNQDFSECETTTTAREYIRRFPWLFRGHVKTSIAQIYTTEEYNKMKKDVEKIKLP